MWFSLFSKLITRLGRWFLIGVSGSDGKGGIIGALWPASSLTDFLMEPSSIPPWTGSIHITCRYCFSTETLGVMASCDLIYLLNVNIWLLSVSPKLHMSILCKALHHKLASPEMIHSTPINFPNYLQGFLVLNIFLHFSLKYIFLHFLSLWSKITLSFLRCNFSLKWDHL